MRVWIRFRVRICISLILTLNQTLQLSTSIRCTRKFKQQTVPPPHKKAGSRHRQQLPIRVLLRLLHPLGRGKKYFPPRESRVPEILEHWTNTILSR